jgi:hypothetical protein
VLHKECRHLQMLSPRGLTRLQCWPQNPLRGRAGHMHAAFAHLVPFGKTWPRKLASIGSGHSNWAEIRPCHVSLKASQG